MADVIHFTPRHELSAQENLEQFIVLCKKSLSVFGVDLDWDADYWPTAGVTFGNLDQKSRILNPDNVLKQPFNDFSKAYYRYQQGFKPSKAKTEVRALKCLERALLMVSPEPDIQNINIGVLDSAATLARELFSPGMAYHAGRELARLAAFISERNLVASSLNWKSPNKRPTDTVRTGKKAKENRENKLPAQETLDILADIFATFPIIDRDIFTTSVAAMLLSAPSRISEVLALPVDCEVWETKRDGVQAYGWRFLPGKGGTPMIKWIPDVMVSTAQEAIRRVSKITKEARIIAAWLEQNPERFYRHLNCPNVDENEPLTIKQAAQALGIQSEKLWYLKAELKRFGVSGENTLATLNQWVHKRLPKGFPYFDKERGIRYSNALFCMQAKQLRTDMSSSPCMVWKPTSNVFNNNLGPRESQPGCFTPTIFDRLGYNLNRDKPLKVTSHQFRHLLNTMVQRGGLSQAEIARWSGRADIKQNQTYDHMSEFELVAMLRSHDTGLSLNQPLEEIAAQIAEVIPMTRQEFNSLTMPTAHVTEYGFCVHDFVMSPCQRFRDCLNCSEQVCIKGDQRVDRIRKRYLQVKKLKDKAEMEIAAGTAGADRWYEVHSLTEERLKQLVKILEDVSIPDGAIVKLRNEHEFSPLRRAVEAKSKAGKLAGGQQHLMDGLRDLMGIGHG